ncbi:CLUMA_CG003307, isoform A [Clunio marinus]|uniref:CLUMA_CG003307, isoform A n=1 Tax=Clunio marinus TaxID=568069 RepID=A0A1J1HNC2_9DIPT|nr:CLUMA_CG003307, isoform A [Clunio marinus]
MNFIESSKQADEVKKRKKREEFVESELRSNQSKTQLTEEKRKLMEPSLSSMSAFRRVIKVINTLPAFSPTACEAETKQCPVSKHEKLTSKRTRCVRR